MVAFSQDEISDVESAIRDALSGGPLSKTELVRRASLHLRGAELDALLARLVTERKICAHPKTSKAGLPTKAIAAYGLEPAAAPPARAFLRSAAKGLRAAVHKARAHGVSDAALLGELSLMLGFEATVPATPNPKMDAEVTLSELRELSRQHPSGTLIPVRRLRGRLAFDKARFDAAVLELARSERVILHHHDLPEQLEADERQALVVDRHGTHYVGIALRQPS
jgi:hypothetical protein